MRCYSPALRAALQKKHCFHPGMRASPRLWQERPFHAFAQNEFLKWPQKTTYRSRGIVNTRDIKRLPFKKLYFGYLQLFPLNIPKISAHSSVTPHSSITRSAQRFLQFHSTLHLERKMNKIEQKHRICDVALNLNCHAMLWISPFSIKPKKHPMFLCTTRSRNPFRSIVSGNVTVPCNGLCDLHEATLIMQNIPTNTRSLKYWQMVP